MVAASELVFDVRSKTRVDTIDDKVSLKKLLNYINKDARTLIVYRKLAFEHLAEYRQSCTARYPEYSLHAKAAEIRARFNERPKNVYPDPPPFTKTEARILIGISLEFDDINDRGLVITRIQRNPYFWTHVSI